MTSFQSQQQQQLLGDEAQQDLNNYRIIVEIISNRFRAINPDPSITSVSPLLVGISGGVSVGKSTFAKRIQSLLEEEKGLSATVISADSFLMSNVVLAEKGLTERKGFPETYYQDDITEFLQSLRQLHQRPAEDPISTPIYDHIIYDIRNDERQVIPKASIILFEGIIALRFSTQFDFTIYLDADEEDMRQWYLSRWINYREEIRKNPTEFFQKLMHLDEAGFRQILQYYWDNCNLPNLKEFIEPTKQLANIIVKKDANHIIAEIVQ